MDVPLPRRAPRRNRQPLKQLLGEMSRVVGAVRERIQLHDPRVSADDVAQMIVCGFVTVLLHPKQLFPAADWLLAAAPEWQQDAMQTVFAAARSGAELSGHTLTSSEAGSLVAACSAVDWEGPDADDLEQEHLYERFLAVHAAGERRRRGVFFTPRRIVRFMLTQVDRQLREEFGCSEGIADRSVRLVDPAAGTGAFLYEAVMLIHARFVERRNAEADAGKRGSWNQYVVEHLLPRLTGIELMPTSCFLASLHIAVRLAHTGFDFRQPIPFGIQLGNALSGPGDIPAGRDSLCVVLGNPPFSYLSENDSAWIKGLVRGDHGAAGYLEFDGERLGERKTWLHDDYVKFLRYAQWRVDSASGGIIAFVTNHGYLDNATFRFLRRQLMRSFPRIDLIDLHGNRKKGEVAPGGGRDENVFGLDQGVAIGLFRTHGAEEDAPRIEHAELWGTAASKLATLEAWTTSPPDFRPLTPASPDYRWALRAQKSHPEYERAVRLPDAMPVYTTAPVTARDGLVVAFTHEELLQRIEYFCDLSIPDERVRRELFPQSRTARYPAGDTRGWKLSETRRTLAGETNLASFIRRCQYRPFDWRYLLWHEAMIDWPRSAVMRHLAGETNVPPQERGNVALIARRQMLPSQPCTYFWVTDALTLDGVIRSDNRGSEAVFPEQLLGADDWRLNLAEDLPWERGFSFVDYAYALFHAPGYRRRYAEDLQRDFPRVLLPQKPGLANRLAGIGQQLIKLHCLKQASPNGSFASHVTRAALSLEEGPFHVAASFPRFEAGKVLCQPTSAIAVCSAEAWEFRVGGHQVLRKWLADRRGRRLDRNDLQHYQAMVWAVKQTLQLLPELESAVHDYGGWPHAFR